MNTLLIDDHLLLRVLLDDEPRGLRPFAAAIATTGLWYHRLCRALADDTVIGSMSRRLGAVDEVIASDVVASVVELPETVGLVSLRTLAWPMGVLVDSGVRLNLMALEALAAAVHLDAEICLAQNDDNRALRAAATAVGVACRTIADP